MNTRLSLVGSGLARIACACCPFKRKYKVTYFDRVWIEQIKMYSHNKVEVEVMAYSDLDAARQVNPEFKPGHNCWVIRVFDREK